MRPYSGDRATARWLVPMAWLRATTSIRTIRAIGPRSRWFSRRGLWRAAARRSPYQQLKTGPPGVPQGFPQQGFQPGAQPGVQSTRAARGFQPNAPGLPGGQITGWRRTPGFVPQFPGQQFPGSNIRGSRVRRCKIRGRIVRTKSLLTASRARRRSIRPRRIRRIPIRLRTFRVFRRRYLQDSSTLSSRCRRGKRASRAQRARLPMACPVRVVRGIPPWLPSIPCLRLRGSLRRRFPMRAGSMNMGGLVGVASTYAAPSIKVYKDRHKYNEWEFIFDLKSGIPGQASRRQPPAGQNGKRRRLARAVPGQNAPGSKWPACVKIQAGRIRASPIRPSGRAIRLRRARRSDHLKVAPGTPPPPPQ